MAGRPKRRALIKTIEEHGGVDAIIQAVEDGASLAGIAKHLGVTRPMLSTWLNRSPETKERLATARETSAHALADESLDVARTTDETNARANAVIIKALQWNASKRDRHTYGDQPQAVVQVNVNTMHLDALRKVNSDRPQHVVVDHVDNDEQAVSD